MARRSERVQKLTKRVVDAAQVEASRYFVWDSELTGFALRVEPSGRKTFTARYRAGGGRTGTLRQSTVGRYGTVTVDEARTLVKKLLGAAAGGRDPIGEKHSARKAGATVAEVCDWYLKEAEAGRILKRRGKRIKASTIYTDRSRINAHVKPLIGNRRVRDLSVRHMEEMQANIAMGKTARKVDGKRPRGGIPTGGGGVGARTLAMMSAIFAHAMRGQVIDHNPADGARRHAYQRRKKRLSIEQIRQLGRALADAATADENPTALAAIRLIALSGLRRGEALGLKKDWLISGGISFPDTKTDAQARAIGKPAMDLLRVRAKNAGEWFFPADRGEGHFVGLPKVLTRICKLGGLEKVTPHLLRHTFGSIAGDLGFSELTIDALLGHGGSGAGGYVHLDQILVAAADRVASVIAAALDGEDEAKIIQLRPQAG